MNIFFFRRYLPVYRKILHSGLFDRQYYLDRNQDVFTSGLDPLAHYIASGFKENRCPHPLFDPSYYISQFSEVSWSRTNPLLHYIQEGEKHGFEPHPLFSPEYYREQCQKKGIDVSGNLLAHYIEIGGLKKVDPHPLFHSNYFAATILESFNVTVENPLLEYLSVPDYFMVSPHPLFDILFYSEQITDNTAWTMPLLLHYSLYGYKNGLEPHPLFDTRSYYRQMKKTTKDNCEPLGHYLKQGRKTGLNPLPFQTSGECEGKGRSTEYAVSNRKNVREYIRFIGLQPDENSKSIEKQLYIDSLISKKTEENNDSKPVFNLYLYLQKKIEKKCGNRIW